MLGRLVRAGQVSPCVGGEPDAEIFRPRGVGGEGKSESKEKQNVEDARYSRSTLAEPASAPIKDAKAANVKGRRELSLSLEGRP